MEEIKKFYNPQAKNFIKFYTEGDLKNYISEKQDKKDGNFPEEDRLEIRYAKIGIYRIYFIACQCGAESNKLLVAERGLRCQNCAVFHRKETFNKLKLRLHSFVRQTGDKIKITEQPFLKMKQEYAGKYLRATQNPLRTLRTKQ